MMSPLFKNDVGYFTIRDADKTIDESLLEFSIGYERVANVDYFVACDSSVGRYFPIVMISSKDQDEVKFFSDQNLNIKVMFK